MYRGRTLVEALKRLRESGLNLVFSTAIVNAGLYVTVEPDATDPRAILEQLLAPLGLDARDGPAGSILVVPAGAGDSGSLRGRVLSASSGTAVATASLSVPGAEIEARARPDGSFEFPGLPAGTYDLLVQAPGFFGTSIRDARVASGAPLLLTIRLEPRPGYVEAIVVTPSRHSLVTEDQASRLTVSREDAVLVPTIGGDISRVIEALPAVAAPDNSAAFNVRGSVSRDVALVLDGLELYEPFHLRSFHSPFSLIDTKVVDAIDFLGGSFTADMGDRHGGFVEMTTGPLEGAERTVIELGTLNTRVSHAAPTSKGSLLLSVRTWYPEARGDTIELGEEGIDPRFVDAYVKSSYNMSPRTVVSAHALVAADRLEFRDGADESVDAGTESAHTWLRALTSWSARTASETIVSAGRLQRSRSGIADLDTGPVIVQDERTLDFFGLKEDLTWRASTSHVFKAGVQVRPSRAEYHYREEAALIEDTHLSPSGTSVAAYLAHRAALSDNVSGELGLRWDLQTHTNDQQLSPRLNLGWRIGARSEVRLGIGRFFQSQRIHELAVEDGETGFAPAEQARQADVTIQHGFGGGLRLRLDAYYRVLSRLHQRYENLFSPLEMFPETEPDRVPVSPDAARLRGAELLLRGDPARPFQWWVGYAWSSAEDVVDGAGVPRNWDQTHAGKFLIAYRSDDGWSLALSGSAHTGWPTTPMSAQLTAPPGGPPQIVPIRGPRNSDRLPMYARLDLKAGRSFPLPSGRLRMDVEILNLTDRENVCCVGEFFYRPRPGGTVEVEPEIDHWRGLTPAFSVLWAF